MQKYVFFDLDGPLLDVSGKFYRVYADLLQTRAATPLSQNEYWECKRNRVADDEILRRSGLEGWTKTYQQLRRERIETPDYLQWDRVWPGVPQVLQLCQAGHRVLLVTLRNSRPSLMWELETLGLLPYFHEILSASGDQTKTSKPNIKAELVRRLIGNQTVTGWFIGDTETDLIAGKMLDLKTVATSYGIRTCERLKPLKPDSLLASPQDLVTWARSIQ